MIRNVFVLGTCKPIVGAHVIECKDEEELLERWAQFVREVDPDIMTGYNIDNFDIPYLLNRGKALRLQNYNCLGRLANTYVSFMYNAFLMVSPLTTTMPQSGVHGEEDVQLGAIWQERVCQNDDPRPQHV